MAGRFGSPVAGVSDGPGTGRRAVLAVSCGRRACVRACGNRAVRGAGLRGRGGRASERPSESGLQLWRRPEGSGSGRRGPGRGRTRGAARPLGIGGLCFASSPMGGREASRPICSRWRAELSVVFVLARASFPVAPGSACLSAVRALPSVLSRGVSGPGSEALASPGRSSRSSDPGVREGDEKFVLKNFLTEFTLRDSSLQGSGQDELPGLVKIFLLTCLLDLKPCATMA